VYFSASYTRGFLFKEWVPISRFNTNRDPERTHYISIKNDPLYEKKGTIMLPTMNKYAHIYFECSFAFLGFKTTSERRDNTISLRELNDPDTIKLVGRQTDLTDQKDIEWSIDQLFDRGVNDEIQKQWPFVTGRCDVKRVKLLDSLCDPRSDA